MSHSNGLRRARVRASFLFVLAAALAAALVVGVQSAASKGGGGDSYIVQLAEEPVVSYTGGTAGYDATAPAKGQKVDATSANTKKYVDHLNAQHNAVASKVGATPFYHYDYVVNGFAAGLSDAQAAALRKTDGVLSVEKDRLQKVTTDNTPTFLGLNASGGLWSQNTKGGPAGAGENVIVGIIDTGIWPEHPSFSDQTDLVFRTGDSGKRSLAYGAPPASWHGSCQSGEQWSQDFCGNKLIGARYYLNGYGHFGVLKNDYKSPRDADGHGTHTSSTAAGNFGVSASILGSDLGKVSGMAPRARVAMYKVCWNGEAGGCPNTDSVAAIDQAIADGVDVLNYSIGGTTSDYLDAVEVAFLRASRAGVFVSASAGNEGPGVSTVAHISPWLMTVAASTQDRSFEGAAKLGNGASYTGVTLTGGVGSAPLVDAATLGDQLCHVGALQSAAGKIVLCRRGDNARVEKSLAVKQAGGVGMILYNASDTQSLNTDNHYIPSVHINNTDGLAVKAYAATAGATASIVGGKAVHGGGNTMADFSSRGPSIGGGGDVLKPDVTAPGVNVLAGNSPTAFLGAPGQLFQSISGTSMSSPHVAGLAALLIQKHPDWSPAAIKSLLMTSARQNLTKEDGSTPADPFDFGAGHVVPNGAAATSLVYDITYDQYRGFLKGQGLCNLCFGTSPATAVTATNLNLPSFAVAKLAGTLTVTRTLTNMGAAGTYNVTVNAPAGIAVDVSPSTLTFGAGESKSYSVTFTTQPGATFNAYTFGSLTWSNGTSSVRSPIAIRPVPLAAPSEIAGTGASGSNTFSIRFGYTGAFTATPQGLQAAHTETRTLTDDPTNDFNTDDPTGNQGIQVHSFTIPAGTPVARFQTFGTANPNDDLDLYVYKVAGSGSSATRTLVGLSGGGTAAESVTLNKPSGAYEVYVHGWEVVSGVSYTLYDWVLNPAAAGNLSVSAPASATVGGTASVTVNWSGLTAGTKYLGRVSYGNGSNEVGGTIVRVDS
jgi:subtilisin family serine protease